MMDDAETKRVYGNKFLGVVLDHKLHMKHTKVSFIAMLHEAKDNLES